MTTFENACELYWALDSLLNLIQSGKIKTPSLKELLGNRSMASLPVDEHGNSVWPDMWNNLTPAQWEDMKIIMAIAKAEAVWAAFRGTYERGETQ